MILIKELLAKYNLLQSSIFKVIEENRCRGDDNVIDNLDELEWRESEFMIDLEDFLGELQGLLE
ncbi:MAG: hypothetical protein ACRCTZ_23400 [Sarcina sp.]